MPRLFVNLVRAREVFHHRFRLEPVGPLVLPVFCIRFTFACPKNLIPNLLLRRRLQQIILRCLSLLVAGLRRFRHRNPLEYCGNDFHSVEVPVTTTPS
jgi:hypothetical protein